MSAVSLLGGAALLVAAFAFHVRARLLGEHGQGWPEAPRAVRWAIDAALLPMVPAGFWWMLTGSLPDWLVAGVALGLAAYGSAMAFNIARQRASEPRQEST